MIKVFIAFCLSVLGTYAYADQKVGEISCNVLNSSSRSVNADIYGTKGKGDDSINVSYANIKLTRYNRKTQVETVLKSWDKVPTADSGMLSTAFEADGVRLEAYGDDVGAMSELRMGKKSIQLRCDVNFE